MNLGGHTQSDAVCNAAYDSKLYVIIAIRLCLHLGAESGEEITPNAETTKHNTFTEHDNTHSYSITFEFVMKTLTWCTGRCNYNITIYGSS